MMLFGSLDLRCPARACRSDRRVAAREQIIWALTSLGFFALMVDERFALHERFRDVPRGEWHSTPVGLARRRRARRRLLASLVLLSSLLRLLRAHRAAFAFSVVGVVLAGAVVSATTLRNILRHVLQWDNACVGTGQYEGPIRARATCSRGFSMISVAKAEALD